MTTATRDIKTPTPDALLAAIQKTRAELQQAFDAMLDPRDIPGSFSRRQRDAYEERRHRLQQHVGWCDTLTAQVTQAAATRAAVKPKRDRLLAAQAAIEQQIAAAGDWRAVADARERDQEWARQNGLTASLAAITRGVEYPNGQPALPSPLRELLTDTCSQCGHVALAWSGPIGPLEDEIAKAQAVLADAPAGVASLRTNVAAWLAEPVTP